MNDIEDVVDKSKNELDDLIGIHKVNYAGKLIHQIQIQEK
jgi:hypothetical protein